MTYVKRTLTDWNVTHIYYTIWFLSGEMFIIDLEMQMCTQFQ